MKKFLLKEKDIDGNQRDRATYLNKGVKGNYDSICFKKWHSNKYADSATRLKKKRRHHVS